MTVLTTWVNPLTGPLTPMTPLRMRQRTASVWFARAASIQAASQRCVRSSSGKGVGWHEKSERASEDGSEGRRLQKQRRRKHSRCCGLAARARPAGARCLTAKSRPKQGRVGDGGGGALTAPLSLIV